MEGGPGGGLGVRTVFEFNIFTYQVHNMRRMIFVLLSLVFSEISISKCVIKLLRIMEISTKSLLREVLT